MPPLEHKKGHMKKVDGKKRKRKGSATEDIITSLNNAAVPADDDGYARNILDEVVRVTFGPFEGMSTNCLNMPELRNALKFALTYQFGCF